MRYCTTLSRKAAGFHLLDKCNIVTASAVKSISTIQISVSVHLHVNFLRRGTSKKKPTYVVKIGCANNAYTLSTLCLNFNKFKLQKAELQPLQWKPQIKLIIEMLLRPTCQILSSFKPLSLCSLSSKFHLYQAINSRDTHLITAADSRLT